MLSGARLKALMKAEHETYLARSVRALSSAGLACQDQDSKGSCVCFNSVKQDVESAGPTGAPTRCTQLAFTIMFANQNNRCNRYKCKHVIICFSQTSFGVRLCVCSCGDPRSCKLPLDLFETKSSNLAHLDHCHCMLRHTSAACALCL